MLGGQQVGPRWIVSQSSGTETLRWLVSHAQWLHAIESGIIGQHPLTLAAIETRASAWANRT
jgi:hypothetical protein